MAPRWRRRPWRFALYILLGLPLVWFSFYEGLVLILLVGVVVEFACFPGKR